MKFNRLFGTFVVLALAISLVSAVVPFGVETINEVNSTTAAIDVADSTEALAGNVTEITVDAFSTTQSWAGYFGNVSGTVQLADVNDNVMYNWSLAAPEGEIYASRIASVSWDSIQCFNYTATNTTFGSDSAATGATNLQGYNLTWVEAEYGIEFDAVDGFDETFTLQGTHENGGGFNHSLFYTNNYEFAEGECLSTHLMSPNGAVVDAQFEEVLLYDYTNNDLVFTSILLEANVNGFDGRDHDFQMVVPEDGHGTDTVTTTYYFYVELE